MGKNTSEHSAATLRKHNKYSFFLSWKKITVSPDYPGIGIIIIIHIIIQILSCQSMTPRKLQNPEMSNNNRMGYN